MGERRGHTCLLSFSRLVFWILEFFVPSPSSNKHKWKIIITSFTSHSICTSKTLKASPNIKITQGLLAAYELYYLFFLCVFPKSFSCHLLMKEKQEFIIYSKKKISTMVQIEKYNFISTFILLSNEKKIHKYEAYFVTRLLAYGKTNLFFPRFVFLHNWINELENEKYLIKIKKFKI